MGGLIQPTHTHPSSRPRPIMNTNIQKKDIIIYYHYYCFSMCSSSLSLICSCVSILILQWLSSPHILTQQGLSHDTLQCDKNENGFKADSDNPIFICIYNNLINFINFRN